MDRNYQKDLSIVLFFTRGVSLRTWEVGGLFEREVALYRRLQERGISVTFVTYGDAEDLEYRKTLPNITICCNRWSLPLNLYTKLIPWLHRTVFNHAHLIKTNQTNGADVAMRVAKLFRKPFLARCGYMLSDFVSYQHGASSMRAKKANDLEEKVFHSAAGIIVTTPEMRNNISHRFNDLVSKSYLIPNYVDTDLFKPTRYKNEFGEKRLCFLGRLEPQKNLLSLIKAVNGLDVYLDIIGAGAFADELKSFAASNYRITIHGSIDHKLLPSFINRSTVFILPSLYEGHPKALIEAMACGVPVIGTDVPGIREIIHHGKTGLLCGTDAESIRGAIERILSDTDLQTRLGVNAREYVLENFRLDRIVDLELDAYHDVLQDFV